MSEMNDQPKLFQEDILDQAIARLVAGENPEAILASFGPEADWLAPMLTLAAGVRSLGEALPVPPAEASLAALLAAAERIAPASPTWPAPRPWWERLAEGLRLPAGGIPRLAATAASVVLAVVVLTLGSALFLGTTTAAAQGVLPGQPLYPIKRLGEEMVLRLPQSSQSRDVILTQIEERRREEVYRLLDQRLEARVTFQGEVETLSTNHAVVSGIPIQVTGETQIEGPLAVGAWVQVVARTVGDETLIAEKLVVEQPAPPTATPSPTPTATPSATRTPTASPTATPTQEPTPTPEPTSTPTQSPTDTPEPTDTPGPTDTPVPAPTPAEETPEPPEEDENENNDDGEDGDEDDGNDNDDDGGGGNDNDNDNDSDQDDDGNDNGGDEDNENVGDEQDDDSDDDNSNGDDGKDNDSGETNNDTDDRKDDE